MFLSTRIPEKLIILKIWTVSSETLLGDAINVSWIRPKRLWVTSFLGYGDKMQISTAVSVDSFKMVSPNSFFGNTGSGLDIMIERNYSYGPNDSKSMILLSRQKD